MNTNKLVAIFLFFTSFRCSQLFLCSHAASPTSLNMHVVSIRAVELDPETQAILDSWSRSQKLLDSGAGA